MYAESHLFEIAILVFLLLVIGIGFTIYEMTTEDKPKKKRSRKK